jgi:hypothetical protein
MALRAFKRQLLTNFRLAGIFAGGIFAQQLKRLINGPSCRWRLRVFDFDGERPRFWRSRQ